MKYKTPMMQQYAEIKEKHQDCILFFRLGDFYEMFDEDAILAAQILDITLTCRNKNSDTEVAMCGIPYHAAESYIAKLNQHGKKIAICEQISAPTGTGIVERQVVKIVTPGTNMSDLNLEAKLNQFVMGVHNCTTVLIDISTGETLLGVFQSLEDLINKISSYNIKEIIYNNIQLEQDEFLTVLEKNFTEILFVKLNQQISTDNAEFALKEKFHTHNLFFLGDQFQKNDSLKVNFYQTLTYIESLIQIELTNLSSISFIQDENSFELDKITIKNLEIFYTNFTNEQKNSLLKSIDLTKTGMGGRLFQRRLINPLKQVELIEERLNYVEWYFDQSDNLKSIRQNLSSMYDLERLINKLTLKTVNSRDLLMIATVLELSTALQQYNTHVEIKVNPTLQALLSDSIEPDFEVGIFKNGYNTELDRLKNIEKNSKDFVLNLKNSESEKTGIKNLKIGFNKIFGYYIEVSKGKTEMVPEYFIRKQTLTNCERYITKELKEFEETILQANNQIQILEAQLFEALVTDLQIYINELRELSVQLASIDYYSALAQLAIDNSLVKPMMSNEPILDIEDGRHIVIENMLSIGSFISNNCKIKKEHIQLITGPNMGGKSTYLRQNALIVLMAQIGSFVPAKKAIIGVVDQIFTRVGANDNLTEGSSTFMVEMSETAYILKYATKNSLLILDEIGRGTSTYDGLSLAWSIFEFIHNTVQARTLFATHYHELIELADSLPQAQNLSVSVIDDGVSEPVFLHKIEVGAIDKSYGVHVAKMAGVPNAIIDRASILLNQFQSPDRQQKSLTTYQEPLMIIQEDTQSTEIKNYLESIEVNNLTPLEALQKLHELKKLL